jgi:hypothetical protein
MSMTEKRRDIEPYRLSAEERAESEAALAEVERGELASAAEVEETYRR